MEADGRQPNSNTGRQNHPLNFRPPPHNQPPSAFPTVTMSVLHPVSISAHNSFLPFSNAAATSLVEYLPPELQANCLLLGGGDVRKILYTLSAEQKNGFFITAG
jgi:hypothetical protein